MRNLPFVMEFILNLTYRCNLRCQMCTQYGKDFKENACEDLDINVWLRFLDSIKDTNPKPKLILMGGEPLLYKDFDKLFITANSYGLKTHIITNGYYLDKYLPILKDTETSITISIDGLFDTHDSIRGMSGLFDKVIKNIEKIDKLQKSGSKIDLRINHVMLPENIDKIIDFHKYFKKYKIETCTFQHLQFSSDELNQLSQKEWKERLNQDFCNGLIPKKKYNLDEKYANKIAQNLDKFRCYCKEKNCFVFPALENEELKDYYTNLNLDKLRKHRICVTPWMNPAIHSNGCVSNCIANEIGNIKDDDFWDIWENEKAQRLRDSLLNDGKFTVCTKCCNFYKSNFVASVNRKLTINGKKLLLPSELNFVQSSQKIAFIRDAEEEQTDEYIPVIAVNIHNKKMLDKISQEYRVIDIID